MTEQTLIQAETDIWAIVELMGHARTAGRISQPGAYSGMIRVDVPSEDGFHTEFYGNAAIYSIKLVSEEIARAYATPQHEAYSFDAPIVPRQIYEDTLRQMRQERTEMLHVIENLKRRLTVVDDLPRLPFIEIEDEEED